MPGTPQDLQARVAADLVKWGKVIREKKIVFEQGAAIARAQARQAGRPAGPPALFLTPTLVGVE